MPYTYVHLEPDMSVLGSNLAASVAQTALQAQQVARAKDRQEGKPASEIRRVREMFESHLRSFEETDQDQAPTHLHIDGQLPEHQSADQQTRQEQLKQPSPTMSESSDDSSTSLPVVPPADSTDTPLYRHVDIQI